MSRRQRRLLEWVVVLVVALVAAAGFRAYVVQAFFVPSASMQPTIDVGDKILVDKAFFSWHSVHEGDIVVFKRPARDTDCAGPPEAYLVKRVIALPGQAIYSVGNTIYVNGRPLAEPYLPHDDPLGNAIPDASPTSPYKVPAGEFYVMGDNRAISCDSRSWGPVKGSAIIGKVFLVWWHSGHPDLRFF